MKSTLIRSAAKLLAIAVIFGLSGASAFAAGTKSKFGSDEWKAERRKAVEKEEKSWSNRVKEKINGMGKSDNERSERKSKSSVMGVRG
jgi:hypothetical protein